MTITLSLWWTYPSAPFSAPDWERRTCGASSYPYSLPLFGQPKTEGLINVFGQVNGSTTAYRFWPGKIHFKQSILISTEHGNHNDTPADYASLVYYYYAPE